MSLYFLYVLWAARINQLLYFERMLLQMQGNEVRQQRPTSTPCDRKFPPCTRHPPIPRSSIVHWLSEVAVHDQSSSSTWTTRLVYPCGSPKLSTAIAPPPV